MLKVDRQSGGFTPWNEICPKKYRSRVIPVVPLWQSFCNLSYAIPLGFYNSNIRFFQKAPQTQCSWSFFTSILVNDTCC